MTQDSHYPIPEERGSWRSIAFALGIHIALFAMLYIGISFHKEKPLVVEAEIWDPVVRETAPAPPQPHVQPPPPPAPVARPVPTPDTPPQPDPEIVLRQEKEKLRQKLLQQETAREQAERNQIQNEKKRQDELAKQKADDQRKLAAQEKVKADNAAHEKQAKAAKAADDKRKQQEAEKEAAKQSEHQRQQTLKMIMGQATTATTGSGDAAHSQGPKGDPDYSQKVGAKIRSNISFVVPEGLAGNPAVEYEVRLLPDGSIAGMSKLKSSNVPGFDEAVKRAIENSAPYPKNKSGRVPDSFIGSHKPKDQ